MQVEVRLGRVCGRKGKALRVRVRLGRARKRSGKARKSSIAPLVIEKSLLRILAGSLYIMRAGSGIRKQTGPGT